MVSMACAIGLNTSGASPPRRQDRDQSAFAMPDQNDPGKLAAAAQISRQRRGIVDIILEAKILRPPELRFPAARPALVIAQRRDLARRQLLGEFLQRGRLDLRPVAVMVGGSRARDQERDGWPFDIRRRRQHRVDGADANPALFGGCARGRDAQDCQRDDDTGAHALLDLPGLFRQHDRDAVADRIGEFGRTRDQLLPRRIVFERTLGQRTDQDPSIPDRPGGPPPIGRRTGAARRASPAGGHGAMACPTSHSRETPNRESARGLAPPQASARRP